MVIPIYRAYLEKKSINLIKGRTKNGKLKILHKLTTGLGITVFELPDFPEMKESAFDDE